MTLVPGTVVLSFAIKCFESETDKCETTCEANSDDDLVLLETNYDKRVRTSVLSIVPSRLTSLWHVFDILIICNELDLDSTSIRCKSDIRHYDNLVRHKTEISQPYEEICRDQCRHAS